MSYEKRVDLYQRVEQVRNRPLIAYITSLRPNAGGQIAPDVISEFTRQILAIPKEQGAVDILVISSGGDPTVAWRIISLLRERFGDVAALLPYAAYSAATLLAMGANQIVMHPFANLGPVDPQITSTRPGEGQKPQVSQFGSEDLVHYLAFVREEVGITDQRELERAFELLCHDVGAIPVGAAKRSTQLSLSLGQKLLNLHMDDQNVIRAITESLNKSFYHHGYPVGRTEAKQIRLPVVEPDQELEDLLWEIWKDIEQEMECNNPFNPLEVVFSNPGAAAILRPVQQIQLPNNLPPQILQQVYNQILQQIQVINVEPVDYELFHATVESIRGKSEFRTKGTITAVRLPDMNIALNITTVSQKWTFSLNSAILDSEPLEQNKTQQGGEEV